MFVIDAAVKQLVSRSFLKHGVSAVAMAAHNFFESKNFKIKSNQILEIKSNLHSRLLVSLNSL